jgi:hypothetical protein
LALASRTVADDWSAILEKPTENVATCSGSRKQRTEKGEKLDGDIGRLARRRNKESLAWAGPSLVRMPCDNVMREGITMDDPDNLRKRHDRGGSDKSTRKENV